MLTLPCVCSLLARYTSSSFTIRSPSITAGVCGQSLYYGAHWQCIPRSPRIYSAYMQQVCPLETAVLWSMAPFWTLFDLAGLNAADLQAYIAATKP
jgi:hypothetical protein